MSKKRKKVFALPDEWEEKLANAPKVAVSGPTKTYIKTLREALADDKTKKPLSLTKLGEEFLGVDRKTISRWEKGDGNPQGRSQQEETLADWAWQIYVIQTFPPEQWEEQVSMHKPWLGKGKRNPYANEN